MSILGRLFEGGAVEAPRSLRVIGSRPVYQFFLPPIGELFALEQYLCVEPSQARRALQGLSAEGYLTIVVNPDDFRREDLSFLSGTVFLWFLHRLDEAKSLKFVDAPRLSSLINENAANRARFLRDLDINADTVVVVSDQDSYEFCLSLGIVTALSPPPVHPRVRGTIAPRSAVSFAWWNSSGSYEAYFRNSVKGIMLDEIECEPSIEESLLRTSHSIVIGDPFITGFRYEVAVALSAGHTVLASGLNPLWGLEAGIDYFEVTTPEELHYAAHAFIRWPAMGVLMSRRGQAKAEVFDSSRVLKRVIESLDSRTEGRGL